MTSRNRGFCYTINNYDQATIQVLKDIEGQVYQIIGFEVGESGTPHIQGYIHFTGPKRLETVRRIIKGHIEIRRGTVEQAVAYCKKEGDFIEIGTQPLSSGESSKISWGTIMEKAKLGELEWIQDNYPRVWLQFSTPLTGLLRREVKILDGELEHEWWVGTTGTGKSSTLWKLYPNHYQKELNKWWCGYRNEDVVAIEEWSPKNECTGSQLKIWADRYPFTAQIKGGSMQRVRPVKIIVLSNYTIDQCFMDSRDAEPIKRRFTELQFPHQESDAVARSMIFNHTVHQSQQTQDIPPIETTIWSSDRGGVAADTTSDTISLTEWSSIAEQATLFGFDDL